MQFKTANSAKTNHIWNGSHIVVDISSDAKVSSTYLHGLALFLTKTIRLFNAQDDVVQSASKSCAVKHKRVQRLGLDKEKIADAINNPVKTGTSVNKYTGNPVTAYYVDDIHYVAVDNITQKVIQVADMNDSEWKFD